MSKATLVSELAGTIPREESANGSMHELALIAVFALAFCEECAHGALIPPGLLSW